MIQLHKQENWLRLWIRNPWGIPAQVRILLTAQKKKKKEKKTKTQKN